MAELGRNMKPSNSTPKATPKRIWLKWNGSRAFKDTVHSLMG